MREFEKYEMFKLKCPVCGSRNKVHTELFNRHNKFAGYSIKCCNCGNYNQFLLDYETNGKESLYPYINGKQRCIQKHYCPKKDCPLYGTCNTKLDDVDFNKNENDIPDSDDDNIISIKVLNTSRFL